MDNKNVSKIIKCIDKIIYFTKDIDYDDFTNNDLIQDACFMNLTQIGEYASKISDEYIHKHSEVEWKEMKGMRNKIVHDYDGVNMQIIWDTIKYDLPKLKDKLLNL